MNNRIVSPDLAITWLFNETLRTVDAIKLAQKGIESMNKVDSEGIDLSKYPFLKRKKVGPEDEAKRQAVRKTMLEEKKKELETLETRGFYSDGLQPIIILLGDGHLIMEKVIEPFKSEVHTGKGWNIEFKEIDSSQLTIDFVENLSKPSEKDGGILFVSNCSRFIEMTEVSDQTRIVRSVMAQNMPPYGVTRTGWSIVFIEDTNNKEMTFSDSFITYWTKGNLYTLFVE